MKYKMSSGCYSAGGSGGYNFDEYIDAQKIVRDVDFTPKLGRREPPGFFNSINVNDKRYEMIPRDPRKTSEYTRNHLEIDKQKYANMKNQMPIPIKRNYGNDDEEENLPYQEENLPGLEGKIISNQNYVQNPEDIPEDVKPNTQMRRLNLKADEPSSSYAESTSNAYEGQYNEFNDENGNNPEGSKIRKGRGKQKDYKTIKQRDFEMALKNYKDNQSIRDKQSSEERAENLSSVVTIQKTTIKKKQYEVNPDDIKNSGQIQSLPDPNDLQGSNYEELSFKRTFHGDGQNKEEANNRIVQN